MDESAGEIAVETVFAVTNHILAPAQNPREVIGRQKIGERLYRRWFNAAVDECADAGMNLIAPQLEGLRF